MLTRFNWCIYVALGIIGVQLVESIRRQAEPVRRAWGSIVYFWRQARTNGADDWRVLAAPQGFEPR
jgi:hypothetical protein